MTVVNEKHVTGDRRSVMQNARLAIRDVYDAVVELVTNADDRYQRLETDGLIEIVVDRSRGKNERLLQVRDFADGMTLDVMDERLSRTGGRVSGMESGLSVRGTNSRGAKDIAALGSVTFQSIAAQDGQFHHCEITDGFVFKRHGTEQVTDRTRETLGIAAGSGTLVSLRLGARCSLPQYDNLVDRLQRLVALREVLRDPRRKVILRDSSRKQDVVLNAPSFSGKDRVKETIPIPGYPGIEAKLVVSRSSQAFERDTSRFRLGGIAIKSRHAVHEATYFDPDLEGNPHALWFCGKLTCAAIDELWNDYDNRFERGEEPDPTNPVPIIDPSRQSGLTKEHPFVQALFKEALKRLRPLVEEERQRDENQRVAIESDATRRRLNALEKAAAQFMQEFAQEEETARDPESRQDGSHFKSRGWILSPPFAQMVAGHSQRFWLTVNQEVFADLERGDTVQIECLSPEITAESRFVPLDVHPRQEGALRAVWNVKAVAATAASGIRVRVGAIVAECAIEVFEHEADKYRHVTALMFGKKRYSVLTDGTKKRLKVLAPIGRVSADTPLEVELSSRHFKLSGPKLLTPNPRLGVALGTLMIASDGVDAAGVITVRAAGMEATAELQTAIAPGAGLKIKLEDIDLKNARSRWRQNVLEIAARHPSKPDYAGQESPHFRVLMAEIVAEAVCAKLLAQNVELNPEEYENADWDQYYADFSRLFSQFLPVAHKLLLPVPGA
jgi:hypothetical protein